MLAMARKVYKEKVLGRASDDIFKIINTDQRISKNEYSLSSVSNTVDTDKRLPTSRLNKKQQRLK